MRSMCPQKWSPNEKAKVRMKDNKHRNRLENEMFSEKIESD